MLSYQEAGKLKAAHEASARAIAENAVLKAALLALEARVAALEAKRGPGRPRKDVG